MSGIRRGLLEVEEEPAASSRLSQLFSKEPTSLSRRSVAVLCLLLGVSLILVIALAAALTIRPDGAAATPPPAAAASSSSSTAAPAAAASSSSASFSSSPYSSASSAFSSSSAPPLPFSSSSSSASAAPPLFTANVSIAGMDGRQFGGGDRHRIVIVMPNVFGVGPELWNLSAEIAQAGYRALAMDIFLGQPMPRSPWRPSWWDEPEHFYNTTVAHMQLVVDAIRQQEGEQLQSLQAVGYCYGGGVAAGMAATQRPVLSVVSAHPTFENGPLFTLGDVAARMQGAAAFLMPVDDPQFNRESSHYLETLLSRNVEAEFRLYANTSHGFAFDFPNTAWRATMRREALQDTIHWLQEHDSRAK